MRIHFPMLIAKYQLYNGFLCRHVLSEMVTSKRLFSLTQIRSKEEFFKVGDVTKKILKSNNPELIPINYGNNKFDQSTIRKLRWMLQKDSLGQDMFLIGPPGPHKFRIAHLYAQLVNQEVEYVVLSRDTTESDLKQRREIRNGTAYFEDQAAVKAAINGRILILDGIEKAECNVLPVLNNLLENREMPLEDGRLLISSIHYDKLLESTSLFELEKSKVVRVSERFRVIALGLPVPKFRGNPLDPPLRSRFQALDVGPKAFDDQLLSLREIAPSVKQEYLSQLVSFAYAANASELKTQELADFPIDSLSLAATILESNSKLSVSTVIRCLYPYELFLSKHGWDMLDSLMKSLSIDNVLLSDDFSSPVTVHKDNDCYVPTNSHEEILLALEKSILVHDVCLVGERGTGKSTLVKQLATRLSQTLEPIILYQDMTARDLLQQRTTLSNGDTVWRPSPLLKAAFEGKIVVMDGLHRMNAGTLSTIQSLVHEREAQLFDGTRILRHDRFETLQKALGCSDKAMVEKRILKVHKNFRIIALAEPPSSSGKSSSHWLSPEIISMFLFHRVKPMSLIKETYIIETLIGGKLPFPFLPIVKLAEYLRMSSDPTLKNLGPSLSTRQLLRLAKRLKEYPMSDVFELVERTCLSKFLPKLPQEALFKAMQACGIKKATTSGTSQLTCVVRNGMLTLGTTNVEVYEKGDQAKVPDVVFYDTQQHLRVMEALLQDFLLGDHLLLVGNQGVGKNRLVDRLLSLMNRPREYIQLHRDTTVQSLTVQPTIEHGIVKFQDSPLVKAARDGSVLIVDEADKAPTQVTYILKSLIENGEMLLTDGRRILPKTSINKACSTDFITLHPDFRMIVLANRPGFPFLGNDFFASIGDVFSVHAIENPTFESELQLLHNFGPNIPQETLKSLVQVFAQLRSMADQGQLSYPYSTRELINVVKHIERYPKDGVVRIVSNVFDFDAYSPDVKDTVYKVFHEHGIPLGISTTDNLSLAVEYPMVAPISGGEWKIGPPFPLLNITKRILSLSEKVSPRQKISTAPRTEARLLCFTEQKSNWHLPIGETQRIHGLTTSEEDDVIHIMATSPAVLYSLNLKDNCLVETSFDKFADAAFYLNQSELQLASLNNLIFIYDRERCKLLKFHRSDKSYETYDFVNAGATVSNSLTRLWVTDKHMNVKLELVGTLSKLNLLVFYQPLGRRLELYNPDDLESTTYEMDFNIKHVSLMTNDKIVIQSQNLDQKYLFEPAEKVLHVIKETQPLGHLTSDIETSENKGLFTVQGYHGVLLTIPDHHLRIWPNCKSDKKTDNLSARSTILPKSDLIVRIVSYKEIPKDVDRQDNLSFLQVADLVAQKLRFIPLPKSEKHSRYENEDKKTYIVPYNQSTIITVDQMGYVRLWEVNRLQLVNSLAKWQRIIGGEVGQLTVERIGESGSLSGPKVGKTDPQNTPHIGGNTWAGGTGGRDTAGLGGRGGPYRLDAGHNVFQVSDAEKSSIPEEIKQAAREMGKKAYEERLKQIRMDPIDAKVYQQFSSSVQKQVQSLKVILSNLQDKGKERQWIRHQTFGDLDDTKIIEGVTGEVNIYRRRAERLPELGIPLEKPKHLRLLVDLSGSMYRFNGYDCRLEREMAAVLLFMEALGGNTSKWRYDIIGHSGETTNLKLVSSDRPPKNDKERFEVLLNMHAHSQFCLAGDHTLEATKQSIAGLSAATDIDEAFVILLSDANLDRYGIPAAHLAESLTASSNVRSAVVFIGTLGNQADRISRQLPSGSAFVCMELAKLPHILEQIFTSVLLSN